MSRGDIARVSTSIDQDLSLTALERIHNDVRIVPCGADSVGKEHGVSARQDLRSIKSSCRRFDRDENFRRSPIGGDP